MSTQTTNLGLVKPEATDMYDIGVQNGNMDIIDEVLGKVDTEVVSEHIADGTVHVTSAERTKWNGKLDATATATNADTVDGLHMVTMTQAAYDALATKNTNTIYYIVG